MLTPDKIMALNGQAVLVQTHQGQPVSSGRLKVDPLAQGAVTLRVDLLFETEIMHCAIGVPGQRLPELLSSWDGEHFLYRLPPGDIVWGLREKTAAELAEKVQPIVETFAVPAGPLKPVAIPPPVPAAP